MKISASAEYGARILVRLARVQDGTALTAEQLSRLENIPRAYVDQISYRLRRAGLVESQRGSRGGYRLSRPPSEISLGMMVRAVEGAIFEDVCDRYASGVHRCSHLSGCDLSPVWHRLGSLVEDFLDRISVAHLLQETQMIPPLGRGAHDVRAATPLSQVPSAPCCDEGCGCRG